MSRYGEKEVNKRLFMVDRFRKIIGTLGKEIDEEEMNDDRHEIQPTLVGLIKTRGGDYLGRDKMANSKRHDYIGLRALKKYLPDDWEETMRKDASKGKRYHEMKSSLNEILGEDVSFEEYLNAWEIDVPRDYAFSLAEVFGPPDLVNEACAVWYDIAGFKRVKVKDELIDHDFPAPHKDYVYSTIEIDVPTDLYDDLGSVSGSIIIDGLKKEVTARCGDIAANAATLGFVEDVVAGRAEPTKEEYSRRINNAIVPDWFQDKMGELEEAGLPYDHPKKKRTILKDPPIGVSGEIKMKKIKSELKNILGESKRRPTHQEAVKLVDLILDEMCGKDHDKKEKVSEIENDIDHVPELDPEEHLKDIKKDIAEMFRRVDNLIKIYEEKGEEYKGKKYATDQEGYREYFRDMMKRHGIKSIKDLDRKEKAVFFKKVERGWQSEPGPEPRGPERNVEDPLEKKRGN